MTHWKSAWCLSNVSMQGWWSGVSLAFLHYHEVLDKQPKPSDDTVVYKEVIIKWSTLQWYLDYITLLFALWKIILSEGECVELPRAVIRWWTDKNVLSNCMCWSCSEIAHIMLINLCTQFQEMAFQQVTRSECLLTLLSSQIFVPEIIRPLG